MTKINLMIAAASLAIVGFIFIFFDKYVFGLFLIATAAVPIFLLPRAPKSPKKSFQNLLNAFIAKNRSSRNKKPSRETGQRTRVPAKKGFDPMGILILLGQACLFGLGLFLAIQGEKQWLDLQRGPGVMLYLGASLAMLAAFWNLGRSEDITSPLPRKIEIGLFLFVLAVGMFMRLYQVSSLPPGNWFDEASNGNIAQQILSVKSASNLPVFIPEGNEPAQWFYFLAFFIKLFGHHTVTLRLQTAFFGILTLIAFYFLARILWNERVALASTFLLAVCRWHINFSRINFNAIQAPFIEATAVYFLLRALKFQGRVAFILAGFTMGFALHSYQALLLFLLGVIPLILLYHFFAEKDFLKKNLVGLCLLAGAAFIAFLPLLYYNAGNHWIQFVGRSGQVSITNHVPRGQVLTALWNNFKMTIFQYTVWGDGNGRHNLPTAPLLDPVMAVICTVGFGYALLTFISGLLLLPFKGRSALTKDHFTGMLGAGWFFVMIMPGVLTIEAPQALRTIGAIPAVILFSGFIFDKTWSLFLRLLGASWEIVIAALIAIVLFVSAFKNFDVYFNKQMKNIEVFRSMSTTEEGEGRYIKELNGQYYIYSDHIDHPTIRFLAGDLATYHYFRAINDLPAREILDKGVVYVLQQYHAALVPLMKYYYPKGKYTEFKDPSGELMFYGFEVPPSELSDAQGLTGEYYNGNTMKFSRTDPVIDFSWKPGELPSPGSFTVHWKGQIFISGNGTYYFGLEATDEFVLLIDGETIVQGGGTGAGRADISKIKLNKGFHDIKMRGHARTGGKLKLLWGLSPSVLQPVSTTMLCAKSPYPHGLKASYYSGNQWSGSPEFITIDPQINFEWVVDPGINGSWCVEWKGVLHAPSPGSYMFKLNSNRYAEVWINNKMIFNGGGEQNNNIQLSKGSTPIKVRFRPEGPAYIRLYWMVPGVSTKPELIPPEALTWK